MASNQSDYPVQFSVDYPDQPLNRLTTLFRLIMVIPILIVAGLIPGFINSGQTAISIPLVWLPLVLILVFRHKYPRWWFDWNLELSRFVYRIEVYVLALRDDYPSTDEHQAVSLDIDYPNAETDLNRWLPLVKWFLAIPHYIVLSILGILAFVAVVLGWIMVIITAQYPRALFDFIVGVIRYGARVQAYAFMLTTDRYPPSDSTPNPQGRRRASAFVVSRPGVREEPALSLPKGPSRTTLRSLPTSGHTRPLHPAARHSTRASGHARVDSDGKFVTGTTSVGRLTRTAAASASTPAPESPGRHRRAVRTAYGLPFLDCGRAFPSGCRVQPQPLHPTIGALSAAAWAAVGSA